MVRILFLSSLTTSPKCPKYISTYVLFYTLAHLILNFLLCRGSCALMIKALLEHYRKKKKLFFKLQNNRLSHSSFKRHKMNKIGVHFLPFCDCSYNPGAQRRCKYCGSYKHVIHLLQYHDSYDSFPESLNNISHSPDLWSHGTLFPAPLKTFQCALLCIELPISSVSSLKT